MTGGAGHCLLVSAHPLADSLCHHLAGVAAAAFERHGWAVETLDLYAAGFDPVLTAVERQAYHRPDYDPGALAAEVAQLRRAEALVLVFPSWWFGLPAILKGWIDRVWAPGVAFDHAADGGAIRPRLDRLRTVLAVTSLGSPWWVDRLAVGRPVRRMLKTGMLAGAAPGARFAFTTLYGVDKATPADIERFARALDRRAAAVARQAAHR